MHACILYRLEFSLRSTSSDRTARRAAARPIIAPPTLVYRSAMAILVIETGMEVSAALLFTIWLRIKWRSLWARPNSRHTRPRRHACPPIVRVTRTRNDKGAFHTACPKHMTCAPTGISGRPTVAFLAAVSPRLYYFVVRSPLVKKFNPSPTRTTNFFSEMQPF